jgi:hypothetical protein
MEPLSMTENALPRDVAAAAADLLDQGATINRLSRPLTIAALIGLIVGLGVELGALLVAGLLLVTLAGLAETYLAIRTGFDAKLFRRLAEGNDSAACRLDAALVELGVLTRSNPECTIEQRASSARRLLVLQGSALVLQVAVVLLATALAQAHAT